MKTPTWRSNLTVFIIISVAVIGYFFWQQELALQQFRAQAREYSRILAAVVERNINNAIASNNGLDGVIKRFLENSSRFVLYLNGIEKFSSTELSAFSLESGLAGVTIIPGDGGKSASGPEGWLPAGFACSPGRLVSLPEKHLSLFSLEDGGGTDQSAGGDCVIVGLATGKIESLQKEISVERLLQVLSNLHGIAYVRLEPLGAEVDVVSDVSSVALARENNRVLSKTVFPMGDKRLVVALEASHLAKRLQQMRRQFALFIVFLIFGGTVSTWWLFRMQRLRLQQTREFERTLARQHEEAALGRAAETITHEMRNPLNAIDMGLQRLQLEASELVPDHRQLITSMRDAVARSDSIISSLRQYTGSFELSRESLVLADLVIKVITLYRSLCDDHALQVELDLDSALVVSGDRALLGQLLENVIKNGIEAQPAGGFLRLSLGQSGDYCEFNIVNAGCGLTGDDIDHIFEPYFTTKGKGTGLGLAISRKIALAHSGQCFCRVDRGNFYFSLRLPLTQTKTIA
jgi:two-component system, NtrC family, sensor histidine kinase HydH